MLMLTLQAELDWLLDDSIADFEGSPQGHRTHTKWRQLKDHKRQTGAGAGTAQLRLDFDSLTAKWKRRVHDRYALQVIREPSALSADKSRVFACADVRMPFGLSNERLPLHQPRFLAL